MQPLYFVRHADGSFSEADPQPRMITTSDLLDTPKVATESDPGQERAGGGSGEGVCAHQQ